MLLFTVVLFHAFAPRCQAKAITVTRSHCLNSYTFPSSSQHYETNSTISNTTTTSSRVSSRPASSPAFSVASSATSSTTTAATSSTPSPSNRVLLPVEDDNVDRNTLSQLVPSMSASLQYAEVNGPYVLTLNANMTSPQVTLENSNCVAIVSCSPSTGELDIGFSSQECYDFAVENWPLDLVLITNQVGCNPMDERGLYQAVEYDYQGYVGIQKEKRSVRKRQAGSFPWRIGIRVKPVTWRDVSSRLEIEYGTRATGTEASILYTQTVTSYFSHSTAGLTSTIITSVVSTYSLFSSSTRASSSRAATSSSSRKSTTRTTSRSSIFSRPISSSSTVSSSAPPSMLIPSASSALLIMSETPTSSSPSNLLSSESYSTSSSVDILVQTSSSTWLSSSASSSSSDEASSSSLEQSSLSSLFVTVSSSISSTAASSSTSFIASSTSDGSSEALLTTSSSSSGIGGIPSETLSSAVSMTTSSRIASLIESSSSALTATTSSSTFSSTAISLLTSTSTSAWISASASASTSSSAMSSAPSLTLSSAFSSTSLSVVESTASSLTSSLRASVSSSSSLEAWPSSSTFIEPSSSFSLPLPPSVPGTSSTSSSSQSSSTSSTINSSQWSILNSVSRADTSSVPSSTSSSTSLSAYLSNSSAPNSAASSTVPTASSSLLTWSSTSSSSAISVSSSVLRSSSSSFTTSSSSVIPSSQPSSSSAGASNSASLSSTSSSVPVTTSSSRTFTYSSSLISTVATNSSITSRASSSASSSASIIWDAGVSSVYNQLVAGITINNASNLVLRPVIVLNMTAVMEPLNLNDTAYQASLQANFTADGFDSSDNLTLSSIEALNSMFGNETSNGTISNITEIDGVSLVMGTLLGSETFNGTINATLMKRGPRIYDTGHGLQSRQAHRPYALPELMIHNDQPQRLGKREDGWDTFFDIMGDDLIGELCEVCGLISAGRDLYNGIKCLFGGCPAPRQVMALEGTFTQVTKITVAYNPNSLIFLDRGTRVSCVKCSLDVSSLRIEGKVVIIPSEGVVVSAVVTVAQSSVASLLYNIYTPGAYSGGFDIASASLQLDSLTAPGVVTMAPKFLYGIGLQVQTDTSLNVQAGATLTTNDGRARFDVKDQAGQNERSWQPAGSITYPQFSKPGRVVLTPYMKTDVQITLTIFKKTTKNAITLISQTNLGFDAQVLATTQNLKIKREENIETSTILGKRAIPLIPALKPGPTCAAYSLRVTANMRTIAGARVAGKAVQLFNQSYPFGSRCVYFAPLPPPPPSSTSRSSSSSRILSTSSSIRTSSSSLRPSLSSSTRSSSTYIAALPSYPACLNCGPIILDGEFETGSLRGWTRLDTSNAIPSFPVGRVPYGRYISTNAEDGDAALIMETTLRTSIGRTYTLNLRYMFSDEADDCYLNVFWVNPNTNLNGNYAASLSTRFVPGSINTWTQGVGRDSYTAIACSTKIRAYFACYGGQSVTISADSFTLVQNIARIPTCP